MNHASSSPAEASKPWYRHGYLWLVIILPTIVVIAAFVTLYIAIDNADDLCMYLLNKAHVSTVTGRAFGEPNCIRLSFANSMDKIEGGLKRITEAMAKLK